MKLILDSTAQVVKTMIFIEITFQMLASLSNRAKELADYLEEVDNTLK